MNILIGSDAPPTHYQQSDISSWTQRLIWFAQENDVIVLMTEPSYDFVEYVTSLLGINYSKLNFLTTPSRWEGGNFDAWSLLNDNFKKTLSRYAYTAEEVKALWPSPEIGLLAKSLNIEHKLPGARFWIENGGNLSNSKVLFRMIAGGIGIEIPEGGVCSSFDDAVQWSNYLLKNSNAFVVKQNHGGAGQGNEIVSIMDFPVSHSGHSSKEIVQSNRRSLEEYWDRRWNWASAKGTNPFVIERYIPKARTLYVEFICSDKGISDGKIGELKFQNGKIYREIYPAANVPINVKKKIERSAKLLAEAYFQIGYRGPISLDSVVTPNEEIFFTEANARYTGSTHLYSAIGERIVRISNDHNRFVVQSSSEVPSKIKNFKDFIEFLRRSELSYDCASRCGILAVTPLITNSGQIVLASVGETEEAANVLIKKLDKAFVEL